MDPKQMLHDAGHRTKTSLKYQSQTDILRDMKRLRTDYEWTPADFWPESLTVIGSYRGAEVAFQITEQEMRDGLAADRFARSLDALRMAIWQQLQLHQPKAEEPNAVPVA